MGSLPSSSKRFSDGTAKSGRHWATLLQLLVTVVLLLWLFHNPDRRETMWHALRTADWRWMLAAFAAAGLFFIGAFFNQFLPGTTGGDLVRVLYLMRDHPGHRTAGFLSVAVDRLLAVLVLVAMGLGFAWARGAWFASSIAVGFSMKVFAVILIVMGTGLVASFFLTSRHLIGRLPAHFPMRAQIVKLSTVWQLCIKNRREAVLGAIYTIPMLLFYFSAFYFAGLAFTAKVTFLDMTSIMPLVTTVSSLPISLNGIGVREALFEQLLFELCHVRREPDSLFPSPACACISSGRFRADFSTPAGSDALVKVDPGQHTFFVSGIDRTARI